MKICVYGASSTEIDQEYINQVESLGYEMAKRGHSLVFGGGANGLMGAAARGVTRGGGHILGVAPSFFEVDGILYDKCTEFIETTTMRERKQAMEDNADCFIMTPGGIGTFEEFFEILTLKQLGRHGKAIVIFNILGYYDPMIELLKNSAEKKFMTESTNEIYVVMDDVNEILDYLDSYVPEVGRVFKF